MTTTTHHAAGTHCWSQLQTTDPEGAKRFYAGLFGWQAQNTPVGPRSITIFRKHDKAVGALMNEAQGPAGWMTFIAVDDADRIAERVSNAKGTVLMGPFTVESNGRMAVFHDPTGAVFAVWQAGSKGGAELLNEPDTMIWNELLTNDTHRAGQFYD